MTASDAPSLSPAAATRPGVLRCLRRDAFLLCFARGGLLGKIFAVLTNRGFLAIVLYRVSNAAWRRRIPLIPLVLTRIAQTIFAIDVAYEATLGPGIVIVHGFGIVVGSETCIEGDCRIFHGVTFGSRGSEWIGSPLADGHPHIEKGCIFSAGATVLGPIVVGRNSVVGANAVLTKHLPPNSIAAGNPARVIGRRPLMDEFLRRIEPWTEAELASARAKAAIAEQIRVEHHGA